MEKFVKSKLKPMSSSETADYLESIIYEDFAPITQAAILNGINALRVQEEIKSIQEDIQNSNGEIALQDIEMRLKNCIIDTE